MAFYGLIQVGGCFRGLSFPLASVAAVNALMFGVYGNVMNHLQLLDRDGGRPGQPSKYARIFAAGCIAGLAQTVVACPSDLVKVVLQAQLNHDSRSFIHSFIKTVNHS